MTHDPMLDGTPLPEQWRPSNGTIGEMWMDEFCDRCAVDTFDQETGEGDSCEILMALLIGEHHPAVTSREGRDTGECSEFVLKGDSDD